MTSFYQQYHTNGVILKIRTELFKKNNIALLSNMQC